MLIMRSVAEAAGLTTADLMEGGRRTSLCHARAAVYKIATDYGYPKDEIMFFLDRNRTVAYNYEANLAGHLSRNAAFKKLCVRSLEFLTKHPHRVEKPENIPKNSPKVQVAKPKTKKKPKEPEFTDWKGKLGWTFTAEECRREWYAKRAAEKFFMKAYGKAPVYCQSNRPIADKVPPEMRTADAAAYIDVSPSTIAKGVSLGRLHRFKKPRDTSYWFYTAELDSYKIYLEKQKNEKK